MSEKITLQASKRTETGSTAARRLRRQGWLPGAVKFRDGRSEPLMLNQRDFDYMLQQHRSEQLIASLDLEGESGPLTVLLREVQHHVIDGSPLHADFGEVSMTEKMHVSIPIVLEGEPVGVKNQGGVLEQQLFELSVACLPDDLCESFNADVSGLEVGDIFSVEDLRLDDRYEVLEHAGDAVAIVSAPKLEAETAEDEAETAEPEVIGEDEEETEA